MISLKDFFALRRPTKNQLSGKAVVLTTDIVGFTSVDRRYENHELASLQSGVIELQKRSITSFDGDYHYIKSTFARGVWSFSEEDTAFRKAASAARRISAGSEQFMAKFGLRMLFGSVITCSDVVGDYFGPIKQYQVIGRACDLADAAWRFCKSDSHSIVIDKTTAEKFGSNDVQQLSLRSPQFPEETFFYLETGND